MQMTACSLLRPDVAVQILSADDIIGKGSASAASGLAKADQLQHTMTQKCIQVCVCGGGEE